MRELIVRIVILSEAKNQLGVHALFPGCVLCLVQGPHHREPDVSRPQSPEGNWFFAALRM